ncbi:GTP binding domain containing protein [Aphelenchoides avenae]|nr:GTP binding domain containing protein [Aphelenchus avenae]
MSDPNGTRWTKNTRMQFNVTLSDETLDRLGVALSLGVSPTYVEVILTRDVLHESQPKHVLPGLNNVDAYVILVENSSDVAESRASFLRYDKEVVLHHLHASKWASRKRREGGDCEYDVWKKAFDAMNRTGGALTKVSWTESERRVLDQYDLRSMKPAIFIVNVSWDEYIHQDPAFVASTEGWIHESLNGEARSPVILTSIELEEELAMRTPSRGRNAESVFDVILRNVFRYFRLTRFYAVRGNNVRPWHIPTNTPAFLAAGVVFHRPCTQCNKWRECISEYCTTHYDHFNRTAEEHLSRVDVGRAGDIASGNVTLGEKPFVTRDRYYRIQEGDVLRFTMSSKAFKEPEDQCTGFEDTRPLLLHPVGHEVRICIAGLTNTGKTTLFNNLTCSHADVSSEVFTTRRVMAKSTEMADDRFRWLANHFPAATLRPSKVTYVDTPALLQDYDDHCELLNVAPWKHELYEALKQCDLIYLVSKEFNNTFVELWEGDHHDQHSCSEGSGFKGSDVAAYKLMRTQDWKVLAELRDNATLRKDLDELDALNTIEDNLRGDDQSGRQLGFLDVITDQRVRYHDWRESELAVLERTLLLSSKPIVYVLNMDEEDFANASSTTLLEARKYFERNDRDAMVLPFAGHRYSTRNASLLSCVGKPTGATTFLEKTLAHYQLAQFYTASQDLVAAWTFKLGTTCGEAVGLVNATLEPNVTDVEVASMREVVKAGSVEKAHRVGAFRRRPLEEEVEDGDLLVLSPGELYDAIGGII